MTNIFTASVELRSSAFSSVLKMITPFFYLPKVRMNFSRSLISMLCSNRRPCSRFATLDFKHQNILHECVYVCCIEMFMKDSYSTQFKKQNSKRPDISLGSGGQWGFIVGQSNGTKGALSNDLWSKV